MKTCSVILMTHSTMYQRILANPHAAMGKSRKAKTGNGKKKKKVSSAKTTAAEVTATVTTEPVTDVHDGVTPAAKLEPSTTDTPAPTKDNDLEGK